MSAFLVPVDAGQCLIPLEKAIVLIGRQADCDVSLSHSRKISRKHCCIAQVNNKFVVRDLGSTNGVYLNGRRILKESTITVGDDLIIGDVHFKMTDEVPSAGNAGRSNISPRASAGARPPALPPIPANGRAVALPPIPVANDDYEYEAELDDDDDDVEDVRSNVPNSHDAKRRHRSTPLH